MKEIERTKEEKKNEKDRSRLSERDRHRESKV